ncbi:uncharacterized protein LOC119710483 isoform X2 [Motacilla alba alba]|uniref:uncharacterized protein LOC119710483 isoform X1 n=1 Tax=Motacilla alba alba TaxID=1094192 RepID=UPI0018D5917A|nr:uncharacterized protein LOC119710483 isoform X1 [Motacilla alba alba]XP_038015499.1 uncharacterized protein LOC119710483 isoform X2 [Motacilla alba alba]
MRAEFRGEHSPGPGKLQELLEGLSWARKAPGAAGRTVLGQESSRSCWKDCPGPGKLRELLEGLSWARKAPGAAGSTVLGQESSGSCWKHCPGPGKLQELLEGLSWARKAPGAAGRTVLGQESSRSMAFMSWAWLSVMVRALWELQPGSVLHWNWDRTMFICCCCCWMVPLDVHPSSLAFRGPDHRGSWGFSRGSQSPAGSLAARGCGDVPRAPAGPAPARSRTVPGSELLGFVCALALLDHTGDGLGFVCHLEIMFYLIHSSSLARFLSIFSNFYKIKFSFFTRTLPSIDLCSTNRIWFLAPVLMDPALSSCWASDSNLPLPV